MFYGFIWYYLDLSQGSHGTNMTHLVLSQGGGVPLRDGGPVLPHALPRITVAYLLSIAACWGSVCVALGC